MIRAIAFDFDGVLAESTQVKTAAFGALYVREGREVMDAVVAYHLANEGVSRYQKFRHIQSAILGRGELFPAQERELDENFSRLVVEGVVAAAEVPGTAELLASLHGQLPLYVVSATPQAELDDILERRRMRHFFRAAYGSPVAKVRWLRAILDELQLQPRELLFVGDTRKDLETAMAVDCDFVGRQRPDSSHFAAAECPVVSDLHGLRQRLSAALAGA